MADRRTTLANLGERELRLLLSGIDELVAMLESEGSADDYLADMPYGLDDIARVRERIQAARRRVR